jgi:predicted transcriptional regulator
MHDAHVSASQSIAEHARARRRTLRLSQRDLAERAGVSQPVVARWEHGQLDVYVARIRTAADALGVTVCNLIGCNDPDAD